MTRYTQDGEAIECRACRGHGCEEPTPRCSGGRALCMGCQLAPARVDFAGDELCEGCFEGAAQESLSAPDVRDADIALVALGCSQLIASYPGRDHVIRIGGPGVADLTWPRFVAALMFHGLHLEIDAVEGFAEAFDMRGTNAWAVRLVENAQAESARAVEDKPAIARMVRS